MTNPYCYRHDPIVKKVFFAMLVPTILMNLTTAIASLADTMIIGHYLDDLSLSVVTFATPIYMVINTFAALFAMGGCIAMSIDLGRGEKAAADRSFSLSIELLLVIGAVLLLLGIFSIDRITGWLGAGDDVFELVRLYSRIILIGAPVFMINVGLAFFVRNDGRPTLAMVAMFVSIAVDIALNFVFVGFLGWGVAGAAYSTVAGQLISVMILLTHFVSSKNTLKFYLNFNKNAVRIVKNGGSTALHFIYQFITILIINNLLAVMSGTGGVVVYTVVFNLSTVSLALFEGISQTIQPMISVYFGEKSNKKIKDTLRLAFIAVIVIVGAVTVILEVVPQVVPFIFGLDDALLIQQASTAVRIYALSMIVMTINVVIGYYLQSTEKNSMAAIMVSLRAFVLFLAATFILGAMFGMNGIWAAYAAAEVIAFMICIFMIRHERSRMSKKGINSDVYLLSKDIEDNITCYTCECSALDYDEFKTTVLTALRENKLIEENVSLDTEEYLDRLRLCIKGEKGKYIEVEINGEDRKVIIRDNLLHMDGIETSIQNGSKSEYGVVMGWNRICLE